MTDREHSPVYQMLPRSATLSPLCPARHPPQTVAACLFRAARRILSRMGEGGRNGTLKEISSDVVFLSSPCCRTASLSDTLSKRKPPRARSQLKSAAKVLLAMNRRTLRAMRSCQSRIMMSGF